MINICIAQLWLKEQIHIHYLIWCTWEFVRQILLFSHQGSEFEWLGQGHIMGKWQNWDSSFSWIVRIKYTINRTIMCSVAQLCLTLGDPMGCSRPGSSAFEIFQARIWSGLPFPAPGDLPDPGIEPTSLALQADSLPPAPPGKPHQQNYNHPPNTCEAKSSWNPTNQDLKWSVFVYLVLGGEGSFGEHLL